MGGGKGMKDYKRSGKNTWIILLGIIIGIAYGIWKSLAPIHVDEKAISKHFHNDIHYLYFYDQLDQKGQQTYQRLLYTFDNVKSEIFIEETDLKKVRNIMTAVFYDHPEIYYVNDQFEYIEEHQGITFIPHYDYKKEEIKDINKKIEEKTKPIIQKALKYKTKNEQARYLYNYMIQNVEYQTNKKTDQNIISAFIEGKSVCAGYARAYQYLLAQVDIDSVYMVGKTISKSANTLNGEGHAWVMVKMDNDYYYCDPTWGDVTNENAHTCYGYYMMNSEEMLKLYEPEVKYEKTKKDQHYYFAEMGCYLEKYNLNVMSKAVQVGLQNKTRIAEIKCGDEATYKRVKNEIENTYLGYKILKQNGCWSDMATFACIDELRLIELYY